MSLTPAELHELTSAVEHAQVVAGHAADGVAALEDALAGDQARVTARKDEIATAKAAAKAARADADARAGELAAALDAAGEPTFATPGTATAAASS